MDHYKNDFESIKNILENEDNLIPNVYKFKFKLLLALLKAHIYQENDMLLNVEAELPEFLSTQKEQVYSLDNFFKIYELNMKMQFITGKLKGLNNNRKDFRLIDKVNYFINFNKKLLHNDILIILDFFTPDQISCFDLKILAIFLGKMILNKASKVLTPTQKIELYLRFLDKFSKKVTIWQLHPLSLIQN